MNVGIIGAGKLGLPVALAMESKGHSVLVTDINPNVIKILETRRLPYIEQGAQELLDTTAIRFASLSELVAHSEIIFLAIQTPHDPEFEGITPLPDSRKDFDYSYLKGAITKLADVVTEDKIVVVISTVLPGTIEGQIKPLLNSHMKLCYNPFFIAMTTTINDFLYPEFVLFGVDDKDAVIKAKEFYRTITSAPFFETSIANAEAIKVAYNTAIGAQIVLANTWMEIAHKMDLDVDHITNALKMANRRIAGWKYFSGGMGDGGACHPRDVIALSHLAKKLDLSYDTFENLAVARDRQTEWLADLMEEHDLPKVILGYAYKPQTALTYGSPALLLKHILERRGHKVVAYDPYVDKGENSKLPNTAAVFMVGTKHPEFATYEFPKGSVVIDVWRYIPNHREDVKIIHVGGHPSE